jgi:hypothetical protein
MRSGLGACKQQAINVMRRNIVARETIGATTIFYRLA